MTKPEIVQKLEIVTNAFLISLIASFARLLFYRKGSWIQTCLTFFGGILIGTLTGYLFDKYWWGKGLAAVLAILGKETVEWSVTNLPNLLKRFSNKKLGTDGNDVASK